MTTQNLTVNFREAVFDFIAKFAAPVIPEENIIWGNQNEITLPESADYIIYSPLNTVRHGTGVESFDKNKNTVTVEETIEIPVQIDCYANGNSGRDGMETFFRAQALETIARSLTGSDFFKRYNLGILYAENVRNLSSVDENNRMHPRWSVTIHLSACSVIQADQDFFDAVNLNLIETSRYKG
jgi:hypothetical protein